MSNTHQTHSPASADTVPSIIRPAGGFARLPRPEGCLASPWGWQGRKRLPEGGRAWGFHTCPEAAGAPQAGRRPPIWRPLKQPVPHVQLCGARLGQAGSKGFPGRGWKDLVHLCSAKAAEVGTTSEPSTASELIIAQGSPCFHPLAPWLVTIAYQVGPVF